VLKNSAADSNIEWSQASNRFTVGKMSYGYTVNNAYFPFVGDISDVRVYATALSAEDIATLYHTPTQIDNLGNFHTFEFTEDNKNSIAKNGLTHTNIIEQQLNLVYPAYDDTIYFEPDGSA
jgi:hypothetical protein